MSPGHPSLSPPKRSLLAASHTTSQLVMLEFEFGVIEYARSREGVFLKEEKKEGREGGGKQEEI